ncbi:MAG: cell cycle histidine kinase CckA [Parvibaculaceae bacterium]
MSDAGARQTYGRSGTIGGARRGWPLVSLFLAALLAITVGAGVWFLRGHVAEWILIAGAVLSFFGLIALFGFIAGVVHVGSGEKDKAFFDGLADALGDSCVVTDARGRAVYANAAYLKLAAQAGMSRLVGIENIYSGHPDISERIYRLAQAARSGAAAVEEFRIDAGSAAAGAKPDQAVWVRISVAPIEAGTGKDHTLWRHQDISADRARQERAFAHLQYIINYLDQAPAGFFSAEADGRVAYVNATLAGWLGLELAETTGGGLTLRDIVSDAGEKLLTRIARRSGEAAQTETFDLDLTARDGRTFPVRIIHRTGVDQDGRVQPSRSLVLRQRAAGEAADSQEADARLSRFFNSAPVGIAELDRDGVIRTANLAFVSLSPAAQRGAPLTAVVLDNHAQAVRDAIAAARHGEGKLVPTDVVIKADPPRQVQFAVSALDQGFLVYALDTTENKALEVQVAQGQKMQAIGQLAGGVAHDFNNVLTAIIGFSDLLLAKHRPTDPAFADIMNIKQNANRAANLVRQLLAFSRRQTLRPEVLSLTDILADLGNLLGRLLGEKVGLKVIHGRDLGLVKVDVNQFEQVIINLAVNGRDAMPQGGTLTVKTSNATVDETQAANLPLMPPGDYVLCEVIDTGTGIPRDILDKIWEPFFSTKEVGKGTGLGLSTVYGIIKQTGGFIFCDSEVGKGTTFRIYLPRHQAVEAPAETEARDEKRDVKRADLTGKGTILLVEDEDAVRAFAARALVSRGYTVLEASSGEAALAIVAEKGKDKIDLVLSDVVMPEMDGPTLLKELRKQGVTAKVIFISGYAEDAFEKNLSDESDFAFLPKPFSLKQLAEAVKDVMGS